MLYAAPPPVLVRLKDAVLDFGKRILLHFGALAIAGMTAIGLDSSTAGFGARCAVFLGVYVGLVCLLPRGMSKTAAWIFPVGMGFLQCVVLAVLGVPWQFTLPWGGLQTWLQRLLWQRGDMGWEWTAAPWLCMALYGVSGHIFSFPCLAAAGVAVFGAAAQYLYVRLRVDPIHRAMFEAVSASLRKQADARILPEPLEAPVRRLAGQAADFALRAPSMDREAVSLALALRRLAAGIAALSRRAHPLKWEPRAEELLETVCRLSEALHEKFPHPPEEKESAAPASPEDAPARRIAFFQDSVQALLGKKAFLPPETRAHLDSLCRSTHNILECMRRDPGDVLPGDKFLSRYLQSAHRVVDEYIRLAREGAEHESVRNVLARSVEILARLDAAFVAEHERLLRNDTINFSADLNVLDKLLKMEGR